MNLILHILCRLKILSLVKNECGAKIDLELPEITNDDKKLINNLLSDPKKRVSEMDKESIQKQDVLDLNIKLQ